MKMDVTKKSTTYQSSNTAGLNERCEILGKVYIQKQSINVNKNTFAV